MCRNITGVVILAGGDGERLRSVTPLVSGDDRPKQFCSLMGGTIIGASNQEPVLIDHRVRASPVEGLVRVVPLGGQLWMRKKSKGLHTSLLTESWRRIPALMNSRVLVPGSRVRLTQSQESSGRSSNCTMQHVVIPPNGWRLHLGRILWIAAALE